MAKKKGRTPKPKPPTEIALDDLQAKFLADREDAEVFGEFFSLLKVYARSLCLKEIKNKKYLPPERVEEVATEAAILLISQYDKEGWFVKFSFGGALRWKVVEALYKDADEDMTNSLNRVIGDNANQEVMDIYAKIGATPPWAPDNPEYDPACLLLKSLDVSIEEIESVLREAEEMLPHRTMLLFYTYLLLSLRRPKTRRTFPSFKENFLDSKTEDLFELLLLEIRNRIGAHVL